MTKTKKSSKRLIIKGFKHLALREYEKAIRVFRDIIRDGRSENSKMFAFYGLGDTLRSIHELELAGKMYEKAISLAKLQNNSEMIKELKGRIEKLYVFKKDDNLNPVQIEFFMRSIIKLLSTLGKEDWF